MNYESELRRLQRLLRADHEAFLDELDRPWSGMDEDLALAVEIMLKQAATSGGQLPLLEACDLPVDPREAATQRVAWVGGSGALSPAHVPGHAMR